MVQRSLQASSPGIEQARSAFATRGWTQENLATEVGLKTRQCIWRFFKGQPIERHIFIEICKNLDLDWRDIVISPPAEFFNPKGGAQALEVNIDLLVRQVRSQRQQKIEYQCSQLQLLDVNHLVRLDALYIKINFIQKTFSQFWLEVDDLARITPQDFEQFEQKDRVQIPGMEFVRSYSKVKILGRIGSGKTVFLQHLATECNRGQFAVSQVPIFIDLKDFAREQRNELSLLDYITAEFLTSGIAEGAVMEMLQAGRLLLLLDGLDEVLCQTRRVVAQEIRRFSEKYEQNKFVVTCRSAIRTMELRQFVEVEIAPFNLEQVQDFVQRWFVEVAKTPGKDASEQAIQVLETFNSPENLSFSKLLLTPLFLHLACCFFHGCGQLPICRSEFYQYCVDLLLSQWDDVRGVERDRMYGDLLFSQRLRLMGLIALSTLEQEKSLFEQQAVEVQMGNYLRGLSQVAAIGTEPLSLECASILRAIELQHGFLQEQAHGVFCFSDAAFRDYLAAREIVTSHELQPSCSGLARLAERLTDSRWREVFLLTVTMLRNADDLILLMKASIDAIAGQDAVVQEFIKMRRSSIGKGLAAKQSRVRQHRSLTLEQQEILVKYHDANQLLRACLGNSCKVSDAVRQEMKAFLLEK
jgi:predicted NACHT family NTPase